MKAVVPPVCPTHNVSAVLFRDSTPIYGRDYGPKWACPTKGCRATVGARPITFQPLGTLADKKLRELRMKCHAAFDPLWNKGRRGNGYRTACYDYLAKIMGVPNAKAHIGMFNVEQCEKLLRIMEMDLDHEGAIAELRRNKRMEKRHADDIQDAGV